MSMNFSFDHGSGRVRSDRPGGAADGDSFRILVLGDFSGRANRGIAEDAAALATRRAMPVDCDNIETAPGVLGAALSLPVGGEGGARVELSFAEMDDFHPDRIFESVGAFGALRSVRSRLQNSATFADAAAEVRSWAVDRPPPAPEPAPQPEVPAAGEDNPFAALLSQSVDADKPSRPAGGVDVTEMIRAIVAPHIVPSPDPRQDELVAQVDAALSGEMRRLLHHPDFQALEAAWRSLAFLAGRVETDEDLQIVVLDVSKAELAADLTGADDIEATGLHHRLVEKTVRTQGAATWTLLVGAFRLGRSRDDAVLGVRLAQIASLAGAPLLAEADASMLGCESLADSPDPRDWRPPAGDAWDAVRALPECASLGLVLPRMLLRLPYGKRTDAIGPFDFEELSDPPGHEEYLWGNGAFAAAFLLADAFKQAGWDLTGALGRDVDDLPMHVYSRDGDRRVTPCAEVLLIDRAAEAVLNAGPMPLLSVKGSNIARLIRFQSMAGPVQPLAGRWR